MQQGPRHPDLPAGGRLEAGTPRGLGWEDERKQGEGEAEQEKRGGGGETVKEEGSSPPG